MKLPRIIRRKIAAPYQAIKYTLLVIATAMLMFLTKTRIPSAG